MFDCNNEFCCIYCGEYKTHDEQSLEHIWPSGLGGNYAPDFFRTDKVCKKCNNIAGLFVDAEFQKSQPISAELFFSFFHFLDCKNIEAVPLIFMGKSRDAPDNDEVCEFWLGPSNETIYYFRKNDEKSLNHLAKGNPISRRKDKGRVYIDFCTENFYWILLAIKSVNVFFKKAQFRSLCVFDDPKFTRFFDHETDQSSKDREFISLLKFSKTRHSYFEFPLDFGLRFQAKIALGFGYKLFGEKYLNSDYADTFRVCLKEGSFQKRNELFIYGKSLFELSNEFEKILTVPGCFTFHFGRVFDEAYLSVYLPTGKNFQIAISNEANKFSSDIFDRYGNEFAVVLVPGKKMFIGPFSSSKYYIHKQNGPKISELNELETSYRTREQLEYEIKRLSEI